MEWIRHWGWGNADIRARDRPLAEINGGFGSVAALSKIFQPYRGVLLQPKVCGTACHSISDVAEKFWPVADSSTK